MNRYEGKQNSGDKALTIVAIVLCIVLVPILIVNVTLIIQGLIIPDKVPNFAGVSPMVVQTDSMIPEFESGDLVVINVAEPEEIREGDIISFFDPASSSKTVVTHRVVEVTTDENGELAFKTKGDANNTEDAELVPASNLVGKYSFNIKGLGSVVMFLQSTVGILICILVPVLIIVVLLIVRNRKYDKKKDEDTAALKAELEELRARQNSGYSGRDGNRF